MTETWTEAEIGAYLDGELDPTSRERIAAAIETDPRAAAVAARIARTDTLLRQAYADPLHEPIPERLAEPTRDEPAKVVPLARAAPGRAGWRPAALAAGIALTVGVSLGMLIDPGGEGPAGAALAVGPAAPPLSAALETARSGATVDGVRPLASFPLPDATVCREFETVARSGGATALGLACRDPGGAWRVLLAAGIGPRGEPGGTDGFAPAEGAALDAAGALLDGLGAGPALTPDAEAALIEKRWAH